MIPTRPGRGLLPPPPPKGVDGNGEKDKGGGRWGGGYSPDAEKGWKAGQPWKDDRMDPQGRVGQER